MNLMAILLSLSSQLKVFHWQTESFAQHQAFGNTLTAIDPLIDELMETFMGKYDRQGSKDFEIVAKMLTTSNVESQIEYFIKTLNSLSDTLSQDDTDILNIRDEIVGNLNKLKYLLTLS